MADDYYVIPAQTFQGYEIPRLEFTNFESLSADGTAWFTGGYYTFKVDTAGARVYGLFNSSQTLIIGADRLCDVTISICTQNASGDEVVRATGTYTISIKYTPTDLDTVYYAIVSLVGGKNFKGGLPSNASAPPLAPTGWLMVYGEYSGYRVTYDLVHCIGGSSNPTAIEESAVRTGCEFTVESGFYFYDQSASIDGVGLDEGPVWFSFDKRGGTLLIGPVRSNITVHITATDDPYQQGGNTGDDDTGPEGGEGTYDDSTDTINTPDTPTLSVVNTGMISMFSPSLAQVQALGNFMWSNAFDLDTFKKLFGEPMSAILGLSIVPVAPNTGVTTNVILGNIDTGVSMPLISSQYVKVNLGAVTVEEYWGGYLDYSPYTQIEIFLPFIGSRPLSTDDIMGKTVSVNYTIDLLSGACIAFISVNGSVMYQFAGQCALSVPVTGNDWTNVIQSAVSIAASIGTVVATGGLSAPASVALGATMAGNVISAKTRVEKSGSLSGSAGMMGVRKPYIVITRPRQALPDGLSSYEGYPALITRTLGSVSGFTTITGVHLDGLTCTDDEKKEIKTLLESGVIL